MPTTGFVPDRTSFWPGARGTRRTLAETLSKAPRRSRCGGLCPGEEGAKVWEKRIRCSTVPPTTHGGGVSSTWTGVAPSPALSLPGSRPDRPTRAWLFVGSPQARPAVEGSTGYSQVQAVAPCGPEPSPGPGQDHQCVARASGSTWGSKGDSGSRSLPEESRLSLAGSWGWRRKVRSWCPRRAG